VANTTTERAAIVTTLSDCVKTRNTLSSPYYHYCATTSQMVHRAADVVIIDSVAASNNQMNPSQLTAQRHKPRPRIVVVAGPTAVGKTALGIELATEFNGEVVNADSRYLYRGFDLGVAKPDAGERREIPHHLIDILPPDGEMTLARYQDLALDAIEDVLGREKLPILVGGTPLYVNAVVEGWRMPRVPPNPSLRAALHAEALATGTDTLVKRLREVDPAAADRCGRNLRRIIRAIEVYEATGIPMSAQEGKGPPPFEALEIGLTMPRGALYRAIDDRVRDQIGRGLVREVRSLLESGVPESAPAMSSLGYRQLVPYLRGESSLEHAIERIRLDTHRYVRHQETWLRRNARLIWFDVTASDWMTAAKTRVRAFLSGSVAGCSES
jgi:tRNA dimethylallyltransferase